MTDSWNSGEVNWSALNTVDDMHDWLNKNDDYDNAYNLLVEAYDLGNPSLIRWVAAAVLGDHTAYGFSDKLRAIKWDRKRLEDEYDNDYYLELREAVLTEIRANFKVATGLEVIMEGRLAAAHEETYINVDDEGRLESFDDYYIHANNYTIWNVIFENGQIDEGPLATFEYVEAMLDGEPDHATSLGQDNNGQSTKLNPDSLGHNQDDVSPKAWPYNLLLEAINESSSEAYQSPFASKLRKDLDYLGVLSALMYHAGASIEAQPLYTGLHSYAIKYALRGLRLFSQSIGSIHSEEAGKAAEAWVDEHGFDFASAVVKEFSARRCARFQEGIQAEDQDAIQELRTLVEEAIGMAMSTTCDLIKSVVEADDYRAGDVQATLAAAIEEYCPIDNSEGYNAVDNARQLSEEWQEVVNRSGCSEDLSMQALGLPSAQIIPSEKSDSQAPQVEPEVERGSDNDEPLDGERIFYVNVGEGPSRNWDDCRQFGFLAAGGGRKWSKQLEKIKTGDTVIAYLKGYGYVGIGKVTTTATPATKFTVNGVPIKELPLINDTIRSIKRFSKENGEYLIGVDWQVAVPRESAAWRSNAGLYTTALVCASLQKQPTTVSFVNEKLMTEEGALTSNLHDRKDHKGISEWEFFRLALFDFLESYNDEMPTVRLIGAAEKLFSICPRGLAKEEVDNAKQIIESLPSRLEERLIQATGTLISALQLEEESEALPYFSSFFFVGMCQNISDSDKKFAILEDYMENGEYGSLDSLVTNRIAENAFEADIFWSLLVWEDLEDWARAMLMIREDIGITPEDRSDFVISYLGDESRLGDETIKAIAKDIRDGLRGYSDNAKDVLTAFLSRQFDRVEQETFNSIEDIESHMESLTDFTVDSCREILGIN